MMNEPVQSLSELQKKHDYMICIDSDGTVFDAMEIKHKECFCPAFINAYNLQPVSKYARECWDFVNLYSIDRGCNRFIGVIKAIKLLAERKEVIARGFQVPDIAKLEAFVEQSPALSNPALIEALDKTGEPQLKQALQYSLDTNVAIDKIVHGLPPFPGVRESLEMGYAQADQVVISAANKGAIEREWAEHGLAPYMAAIAGQEVGPKKDQIKMAINGRYPTDHVLMIGDAMGDLEAAQANGVLYYPINPGQEDASWVRFRKEAFAKFIDGTFAGAYQAALIDEFKAFLPVTPPWQK